VPQKEYSIACADNNQCKASMKLSCSTANNVCVCPLHINAYRCDCTATQYFDPTTGCRIRFHFYSNIIPHLLINQWIFMIIKESRVTYGSACLATYMCLGSINLQCSNGLCACDVTRYWSGSACGWINVIVFRFKKLIENLICIFIQVPKKSINITCSSTSECQEYFSLECEFTRCQ